LTPSKAAAVAAALAEAAGRSAWTWISVAEFLEEFLVDADHPPRDVVDPTPSEPQVQEVLPPTNVGIECSEQLSGVAGQSVRYRR